MSDYAIRVEGVSMRFNLGREKVDNLKEAFVKKMRGALAIDEFYALKDVSFSIRKGEAFAIIGSNGSGKSTILKIISGILKPTNGKVTVEGSIAPMIELGSGFDMDLTARENIFLNGSVLGYSREFMRERFDEIVGFSELADFIDVPIKNFSSGMIARLGFAIMTIIKPDILIVDEILSVGDQYFKQKSALRMQELMSDGTTIVLVSHSMDDVKKLCPESLWLEKGVVKYIGNTKTIYEKYMGEYIRNHHKRSFHISIQNDRSLTSSLKSNINNNLSHTLGVNKDMFNNGDQIDIDDYNNRLYLPSYITSEYLDGKYYFFIIDSMHHRVLFSNNLHISINEWKSLTEDIAAPTIMACDGNAIIVTETGYDRLRVYRHIKGNIFNYTQCIMGLYGVRSILYDGLTKKFFALESDKLRIIVLANIKNRIVTQAKFKLSLPKNLSFSSLRIIDDMMWIVSREGIIFKINYVDDSFEILDSYKIDSILTGLMDIAKYGKHFYLTSSQKVCIRFDDFKSLINGNYEDISDTVRLNGVPFFTSVIDGRMFIPMFDSFARIVSFKENVSGQISEVELTHSGENLNISDLVRFCKYPGESL